MPRFPTEFDGKCPLFTDTSGIKYKITLQISKINSPWELELSDENLSKQAGLLHKVLFWTDLKYLGVVIVDDPPFYDIITSLTMI